jgi:hypothetical protein
MEHISAGLLRLQFYWETITVRKSKGASKEVDLEVNAEKIECRATA